MRKYYNKFFIACTVCDEGRFSIQSYSDEPVETRNLRSVSGIVTGVSISGPYTKADGPCMAVAHLVDVVSGVHTLLKMNPDSDELRYLLVCILRLAHPLTVPVEISGGENGMTVSFFKDDGTTEPIDGRDFVYYPDTEGLITRVNAYITEDSGISFE